MCPENLKPPNIVLSPSQNLSNLWKFKIFNSDSGTCRGQRQFYRSNLAFFIISKWRLNNPEKLIYPWQKWFHSDGAVIWIEGSNLKIFIKICLPILSIGLSIFKLNYKDNGNELCVWKMRNKPSDGSYLAILVTDMGCVSSRSTFSKTF